MLFIECILKRTGGSPVSIGGTHYLFKPRVPGGPHIDRVDNQEHAARLLSLSEGYRLFTSPASALGDLAQVLAAESAVPPQEPAQTPPVNPAVTPEPEQVPTPAASEPPQQEPQPAPDDDGDPDPAKFDAGDMTTYSEAQLRDVYQSTTGEKSDGRWSRQTLIERIEKAEAEQS